MTPPVAIVSPMRPAKKERPLTTASPERADAITANNVDTTRGSKTTVQCAERAFCAPSIRVARRTASSIASSGTSSPGPRPTLNPVPVCVSAPSPAMASTDRKAFVRRRDDEMPVVEASATSTRLSE